MQKVLKIFAIFIAIVILVGLVLDNEFEVSKEISIKADRHQIHPYINDLNQWPLWSPWQIIDPSVKTTIGNISSGVGAHQSWSGQGGGGKLTFTQSSTDGITYDLIFEGDTSVFVSSIQYHQQGQYTVVKWDMKGKMKPIIIGNYFAQFMDSLVGDSFSMGLDNLKKIVEEKG